MKGGAVGPQGSARARFILRLAALLLGLSPLEVANAEGLTDPFLGQPDAISTGRDIYRSKCLVCHQSAGARGPNIFKTKLSDEQFLATVINGRKTLVTLAEKRDFGVTGGRGGFLDRLQLHLSIGEAF